MLLNKKSVSWKYVVSKILRILRYVILWNVLWYAAVFFVDLFHTKDVWISIGTNIVECIKSISEGCLFQKGRFYVFWYMGTTIILYLLLPLLYRIQALPEVDCGSCKINYLLIVWLFALVVSVGLQMASMIAGCAIQSNVLQVLRIWCSLQYFLLGGFMPLLIKKIEHIFTLRTHIVLAVISTIVSIAFRTKIGIKLINNSYAEYFYDDPLFILSAISMFSLVARLKINCFTKKTVSILAPLMLGVYATHLIIRNAMQRFIPRNGNWLDIIWFIVYIVICFGAVKVFAKIPLAKYWLKL